MLLGSSAEKKIRRTSPQQHRTTTNGTLSPVLLRTTYGCNTSSTNTTTPTDKEQNLDINTANTHARRECAGPKRLARYTYPRGGKGPTHRTLFGAARQDSDQLSPRNTHSPGCELPGDPRNTCVLRRNSLAVDLNGRAPGAAPPASANDDLQLFRLRRTD